MLRLLFQEKSARRSVRLTISKETAVESLQSYFIVTISHWSSRLPVCFPSQGTPVQIPPGLLVPDPGKGVCADPVSGGAILGKGGAGSPRREQGASVEPRQGKREDVIE